MDNQSPMLNQDTEFQKQVDALLENSDNCHRWLSSKPEYEVIGVTGDACNCPLHRFIVESLKMGGISITVMGYGVAVIMDGKYVAQVFWNETFWAHMFVHAVDSMGYVPGYDGQEGSMEFLSVHAGDALAILNTIRHTDLT